MSNLRRRLDAALDAVQEVTAANRVKDGRSEISKWLAILRLVLRTCSEKGQSPEVLVAIGRIRRTLALLEPVEHEADFAFVESACQGARYQLSWPNHPAPWDDSSYEGRVTRALEIDRARRSAMPVELESALVKSA